MGIRQQKLLVVIMAIAFIAVPFLGLLVWAATLPDVSVNMWWWLAVLSVFVVLATVINRHMRRFR